MKVGFHDLVFLCVDLGAGVVGREDQVNLAPDAVDPHDPVVGAVDGDFEAVGVIFELLVQLVEDQLQLQRHHLLAGQVGNLQGQVHLREVEEPDLVLRADLRGFADHLVKQLRNHRNLALQESMHTQQERMGDHKLRLQE